MIDTGLKPAQLEELRRMNMLAIIARKARQPGGRFNPYAPVDAGGIRWDSPQMVALLKERDEWNRHLQMAAENDANVGRE